MMLIVDFGSKPDKERLYSVLKGLKPQPYRVELKVNRDNRSVRQNAYYWGVVIKILSDYTGFDPDEIHELLKAKYLKYYKMLPTGQEVELTKSTKELDTAEFEEFLEKVRRWAAQDLDVQIPLPNEFLQV